MNLTDHLEKLKYFYEVARLGSLKKASEKVFISQPSRPKNEKPFLILAIGYKNNSYALPELRRKELEEISTNY